MKSLINKSSNIYIQLVRYVVAGGVAFTVDFVLLWLLTEHIGVHYLLSTVIAYSVGLGITYLLSVYWIFNERSTRNWVVELTIFALIGIIGLGLTSLSMWFLTDRLQIHYLLSKIVTTGVVFIWNFIAKKFILFKK